MDPRGKYQLDLCGSPTATLLVSDGVVLENNPFYPRLEIEIQQEDAQRLAQGMSRRIFTSHTELRAILDRHEETIQKRWIKKTNAQRQAMLLKVWPKMALERHADFAALKTLCRQRRNDRWDKARHRDPFMWPYINQEDLSKPKALLLLLNARGRHNPCDFAAADGEALRLGKTSNAIVPICIKSNTLILIGATIIPNGATMILNGATGPDEYGRLLAWQKHPHVFDWLRSGKQFQPQEGFMILEAQEGLLSFLVDCCKNILHDISEDATVSDKYQIKEEPQLKSEAETTGFDSLAVMMAEEPYRVPAHLDLERMEVLLAARASAAEDHLWALREDPGYFTETLWDISEHRVEMFKDESRRAHPALDRENRSIFWARVVGEVLFNAYYELEIFSELHRQAQELRMAQLKHADAISPTEDLPTDYLRAIFKFRHFLDRASMMPISQLRDYIKVSPSFRKIHYFTTTGDAMSSEGWVKERPVKKTKFESELLHLLKALWEEGGQMYSTMRMSVVMDELERLLDSDPKAKDLVSQCVAGVIGDLSILSQCFKQLESYQPWARGFDEAMPGYMDGIMKDVEAKRQPWNASASVELRALRDQTNMSQALRTGDISGGRLAYPIDKRRTRENVRVLRQSEASLDTFWAFVDRLYHYAAGTPNDSAVSRMLSQKRTMQRTPEWVEPIKEPKKAETSSATDQDVKALHKPLSALSFGPTPSKSDVANENLTKTKVKTKGTANAPPAAAADDPPEDPTASDSQPTIPVDTRALKVFRTIFHNPSSATAQGEIPWQDFLHAMASIGFAAEKLYGSAWQFRPVSLDVDRNIQFHEPHPRGKVPFLIARRMGRRLSRAYGWNLEMFTLKGK
ncbi:hypothetical protein INS49_015483 [Diaporthe citri]|uniref:uncharacterized protein n=1 Tax=Diaporthe citri TaxID=83186 RepID=UPI001C800889|nr:uncharacterized protein INS49_015483 [Diaporthe citri]KAG6356098.1 hypothetical protein INS49_015483 [Diaporthe citri]